MTWDPVWEDVFRSRDWGKYPGEDVVRFVARNFYTAPDRASVRLLEVGSGTGSNLWLMAREGFCVHGVEGSSSGVRIACERLDRECAGWRERGGRIKVGDMARLEYPDAFFAGAIDVVAVCYSQWDAARGIYAELARVTRPGGRLFIRTFAEGCWGEGTGQPAGRQMWICDEGPLKGLGATRFTAEQDVPDLLPGWRITQIDRSSVTEGGGPHAIRHLLIQGVKAI